MLAQAESAPQCTDSVIRGIYFARVDDEGVLMDLVNNRYIALTSLSARIWSDFAKGVSVHDMAAALTQSAGISEAEAFDVVNHQLSEWRSLGVIRQSEHANRVWPATRPNAPPAHCLLNLSSARGVSIHSLAALCRAFVWVRWQIRTVGVPGAIVRLQNMPSSLDGQRAVSIATPVVKTLVTVRRFYGQGRSDCLTKALTLTAVLRMLGVDAHLCIGVSKIPFIAHAWVELEGLVVDERLDLLEPLTVVSRF